MSITTIRGRQVLDGSIQRSDLDITTVGQAVVAKLVQGSNITLNSTGGDAGTGDVTVTLSAHAPTHISGGSDVIPAPTTSASGLVPALPTARGTGKYLRGDAQWGYPGLYTLTTAAFTMPTWGSNVTVSVDDTSWMIGGDFLRVFVGANSVEWMGVVNVISGTSVVLSNAAGSVSSGTIPASTLVAFGSISICGPNYFGIVPNPPNDATKVFLGNGTFGPPPAGATGPAGVNAFTTSVGSFTVPAVGATTTVTVVDASWIVVGQLLYFDVAGGGAGLAGALEVTNKIGNLLTLLNPTPPAGGGDMLKSVYDTDNDSIVDAAESVPWTGVTGRPSTPTTSVPGLVPALPASNPNNQFLRGDGTFATPNTGMSYDLALFAPGVPGASALCMRAVFCRAVTFPTNFSGSVSTAGTAATASTTFNIAKNGSNIGTLVFGAGGTTGTFTVAGGASFAVNDNLTITAPASPDATLANISVTITGTR